MTFKEQFIPFEIAFYLKEIGFDETCLAYYDMEGKFYPMGNVINPDGIYFGAFIPEFQYKEDLQPLVAAPLWQQAFEWFEKHYELLIIFDYDFMTYDVTILHTKKYDIVDKLISTLTDKTPYCFIVKREAELGALRKLIQIISDEKNN